MFDYKSLLITNPSVLFVFLSIGLFTGVIMGFVGIGGGVILIPLLLRTGLNMFEAVAIGLVLQTLPQSLPALFQYHKNGHVRWGKAILVVIGSFIGMTLGAYIATKKWVPDHIVKKGFALLVTLVAISLWF